MPRLRLKKTILWQGPSGLYFLCRVLNVGRSTDELKIVLTDADLGLGAMYMETPGRFGDRDLARLQGEVSYHSDGTLLLKLPSYSAQTSTEYRNASGEGTRRIPLQMICVWEAFARYTVVRATEYTGSLAADVLVVPSASVFSGPFTCTFSLGPTGTPAPPSSPGTLDVRVCGVTDRLDLSLRFEPSSYRGEVIPLPNTGAPISVCSNFLQILERRVASSAAPVAARRPPDPGTASS